MLWQVELCLCQHREWLILFYLYENKIFTGLRLRSALREQERESRDGFYYTLIMF